MFFIKFFIVIVLALSTISEAQRSTKDFKGRNPYIREKKGYTNISPVNDYFLFLST